MQIITKLQIQTMDQMMDAWRNRSKGDEPHAVLSAMGGAVAESLGRRDAPPVILESRAAA